MIPFNTPCQSIIQGVKRMTPSIFVLNVPLIWLTFSECILPFLWVPAIPLFRLKWLKGPWCHKNATSQSSRLASHRASLGLVSLLSINWISCWQLVGSMVTSPAVVYFGSKCITSSLLNSQASIGAYLLRAPSCMPRWSRTRNQD